MRGLAGLRIVDFYSGIAGSCCTKSFVDAGAGVIKVVPPEGDPLGRLDVLDPFRRLPALLRVPVTVLVRRASENVSTFLGSTT